MRRFLVAALLVLLLIPPAAGYEETDVLSDSASTHQWLTTRIPVILRADGYEGIADLLEGYYLIRMREGTMRADETLWDSREHYMDPSSHDGFLGFREAGGLASEKFWLAVAQWLSDDRSTAMYNLGWATHLVQDLTVPHHARLTALNGHAEYEDWALSHQTDYPVASGGVYRLAGSPHGVPLNTSDPFEWVDANAHQSYDLYPYVDGAEGDPGNDYAFAASLMIPLAQRTSSGFVKMFFETVDAGPPTAEAGPDLTVEFGTPAYLNGRSSDDDLGIERLSWDLGDGATAEGEAVVHSYGSPGTYQVRLTAVDFLGKTAGDLVVVSVVDRTPPRAVAGPDLAVLAGESALLDASGSWDNVGIVNYTWSVAGEAFYGREVRRTFAKPGVYLAELTVSDEAGNVDSDIAAIAVSSAPGGIQAVKGPSELEPREAGEFTVDWEGEGPRSVTWSFGDGGAAEGAEVSHAFDLPGTYRVVVIGWDVYGRASAADMVVRVNAPPPSAEAGSPGAWWAVTAVVLGLAASLTLAVRRWLRD
jgi:phospholipase C